MDVPFIDNESKKNLTARLINNRITNIEVFEQNHVSFFGLQLDETSNYLMTRGKTLH